MLPQPTETLTVRAAGLLHTLAEEIGARPTGSVANQRAAAWFAAQMAAAGIPAILEEFPALDWIDNGATLSSADNTAFALRPSPYSLPLDLEAPLAVASSVEEIEEGAAAGLLRGSLLLLVGAVAADQLFPRNYPFVTLDEQQRVYRALDAAEPSAVLTASRRNPMAGALYPAPLFEDGDFNIPSAYMSEEEGTRLARFAGARLRLHIHSQRVPATATNVVVRLGTVPAAAVVLAHLDTKPTTPGALDNGGGVVTLLLLAELLREAPPQAGVELVAINGEDHYSAAGELAFLRRQGARLPELRLGVNVDGIGYLEGASAWSLYNMGAEGPRAEYAAQIRALLNASPGLVEGPEWLMSDHAMFVMAGTPALAFTSERLDTLFTSLWHTADDTPAVVNAARIAEVALALHRLLCALQGGNPPIAT